MTEQYVYVAHPDFLAPLCQELGEVSAVYGNLVFSPSAKRECVFAQDIWLNPKKVRFESINDAARILKAEKMIWHPNIINCARRTMLIAEKLPIYRNRPITFPMSKPLPAIGCYSLLDEHTLIYSTKRLKSAPNGEFHFVEDKKSPPNRAYLKLWEALTLLERYPRKEDITIDLGASPGGWTFVLQSFGAKVLAVDKAPLAPHIAQLPGVLFSQQSAFALLPHDDERVDWLVCDVACYPERLYDYLQKWLSATKVKQFICTIKLQGETDFESIKKFLAIANATTLHLYHNKHELTWFYPGVVLTQEAMMPIANENEE